MTVSAWRRELGVDGDHPPAAAQQLDGVAPVAAAEIDRFPALARTEALERQHQGAPRRSAGRAVVILLPVAVALFGHPRTMPPPP